MNVAGDTYRIARSSVHDTSGNATITLLVIVAVIEFAGGTTKWR